MESPEWQPCTGSTNTGQSTDKQPDSNPEVQRYSVQPEETQEAGEHQVDGNLALKHPAFVEPQHRSKSPSENYLSDIEAAYIESRPSPEQTEIFDAQDAWDAVIGTKGRPSASKFNEMLGHLRELGYRGERLDATFRQCLEETRGRARDPVAWMISALKNGRYP